jgi:NAD(P)-dependent dehydrogenase (short-subunit alcohol dehydrogenase family)
MGLLDGKHALISGAANGIGRATARRFAAEGAAVCLVDVEAGPLDELVAELTANAVGAVTCAKVDVRDEARVEAAVADAERGFGQLDVVVANAAVEPADDASILDLDLEVWRRVIETNLTGCFLTAKHGARALVRCPGPGRALVLGLAPGQDAYSASKAGVLGLMRVAAADLAPFGVRVNAVMPGLTDTRANAALLADPDARSAALAGIPLGREADPSEIAAAIAWIASDQASYATGSVLIIDGGVTAI